MFTYEPSGNLLLDSYGLPKISLPKVAKTAADKTSKTVKTSPVKTTSNTRETSEAKPMNKTGLIIGAAALVLILLVVSIGIFKPDWMRAGKNKTIAFYQSIFKGHKTDKDGKISEITTDTDTLKNKVIEKSDTTSNKKNEVVKKDTVKVIKKEEITPPVNNKNKTNTTPENYLTPQKGKSYIIVASLPDAEKAEIEKQRFVQMGIKVQIIPAENNKYRLTLGVYNTTKEAVSAYEDFHAAHKEIHPWLWEN